ncbi:TM0106 family RecB-like putative nuclease [uncultured Corynebacterium sp.]|uniref:TM0106 family RecB-like putative nuclease n=1 Tax=uncultured Corynebacterium sp. TaxID=159447 RepID=UPI0025E6D142|nr:TM0106 family RecB-like putative nuclease [uncultured Corynebacterium sp.]
MSVTIEPLGATDLVGCRFRLVQRRAHPLQPPTHAGQARAVRAEAARVAVAEKLPVSSKSFRRVDLVKDSARPFYREMATLELMAAGIDLITNARFAAPGDAWAVDIDGLLKVSDAPLAYAPLLVSSHRVARPSPGAALDGVPTHRLGLSAPLRLPYKLRHHVADGYRLALAARGLAASGVDSGRGIVIGQDRETAFFVDTAQYQPALDAALQATKPDQLPTAPRRVKECAGCRFWELCRPRLEAVDELSLFLPGDRARDYRERGIETVQGLIDARLGEPSALAQAWRDGIDLLRRPGFVAPPRADVEVDVDMEAYLDQGAYLWGAWHAGEYQPFVTWHQLGGAAEAANFQAFWSWLMGLRAKAHAAGKTFAAYCYSAHGENHWMTMSAERFGAPPVEEVRAFIASEEWVDMFTYVKRSFAGPHGLGLKIVAPLAGHRWAEDDFDGEESVNARRDAVRGDAEARRRLLEYNAGDVRATAAIREWMSAGAPGVPSL